MVEVVVAATVFCRPVATTIRDKPKLTSLLLTETQVRPIEDDNGDNNEKFSPKDNC